MSFSNEEIKSTSGEPFITPGTTSQYWRGDKTWQTLDKTAVGLNNVDNTSDLLKPISTATQTALNLKQDTLPTFTAGQVLFGNGTSIPATDSSLFWDNTNKNFKIGSSTSTSIIGQLSGYPGIWFGANTTTPSFSNYSFLYDASGQTIFNAPSGGTLDFRISNAGIMRIGANQVSIGTTTLFARLGIVGLGTSSATYSLKVHDSTGASNALTVRDDGYVTIGSQYAGILGCTTYGSNNSSGSALANWKNYSGDTVMTIAGQGNLILGGTDATISGLKSLTVLHPTIGGILTVGTDNAGSFASPIYSTLKFRGYSNGTLAELEFSDNSANSSLSVGRLSVRGASNVYNTILQFRSTGDILTIGATNPIVIKDDGKFINSNTLRLKGYTVATLPTGTIGDTCYVTDALSPTFLTVLIGGGMVVTTAFFNGTNWVAQ